MFNFLSIYFSGLGKLPTSVVLYTALPMFHMYGLLRLFSNVYGLKYIVAKRFQAKSFFEAVEKYRVYGLIYYLMQFVFYNWHV